LNVRYKATMGVLLSLLLHIGGHLIIRFFDVCAAGHETWEDAFSFQNFISTRCDPAFAKHQADLGTHRTFVAAAKPRGLRKLRPKSFLFPKLTDSSMSLLPSDKKRFRSRLLVYRTVI